MTKDALKGKIAELTKGGHRLTDAEIGLLGRMHKELPKSERDWNWLAIQIGWKGDGENLRQKVKRGLRAMRKAGASEPSAPEPAAKGAGNAGEGNPANEAEERMREFHKERQRLRDERAEYNRLVRDDARIEALKDAMAEAVKSLPPLPKAVKPSEHADGQVEAVALFSDLHVGVEVDDCFNTFNEKVAAERVAKWADAVARHCRALGVARLNVLNLGDLIAGIIHVTIRLQQQFDVVRQVMVAGELLSEALNRLQEAAPMVIYRSCTDNHSRLVADKTQAIEKESLGRLIDWFVEERLKGTSVVFKDDNLTPDLGRFKLMSGKTAMFSHGHLDSKSQVFQNYVGATKEFVDYIFLGHWHSPEQKTFQGCRVYVNGSIVGTDQYARDRRLFSRPSQKMVAFLGDDEVGIDIGL